MSEATLQGFTREFLRSLFDYDPETGVVRWKEATKYKPNIKGKPAGARKSVGGYLAVEVRSVPVPVHRLAWFLHTGEVPPEDLDHRNHDKGDNRFANLRPATRLQNSRNRGPNKNNTSGFKGVCAHKATSLWKAQIGVGPNRGYLGLYPTPERAALVYNEAAHRIFGEFAYLNDIPGVGRAVVGPDCIDLFL